MSHYMYSASHFYHLKPFDFWLSGIYVCEMQIASNKMPRYAICSQCNKGID